MDSNSTALSNGILNLSAQPISDQNILASIEKKIKIALGLGKVLVFFPSFVKPLSFIF